MYSSANRLPDDIFILHAAGEYDEEDYIALLKLVQYILLERKKLGATLDHEQCFVQI